MFTRSRQSVLLPVADSERSVDTGRRIPTPRSSGVFGNEISIRWRMSGRWSRSCRSIGWSAGLTRRCGEITSVSSVHSARWVVPVMAVALLATACGDDDGENSTSTSVVSTTTPDSTPSTSQPVLNQHVTCVNLSFEAGIDAGRLTCPGVA